MRFIENICNVLLSVKNVFKEGIISKYQFYFFTVICSEFIQNIDVLAAEIVEKKLEIDNLLFTILKVAIWSKYDVDKDNCSKVEQEASEESKTAIMMKLMN